MAIRATVASNLRLWMEFGITVLVILGAFTVLALPGTPEIVNQGAYQLCTLTLGYWFGRGSVAYSERRRGGED
jgi:hypothetical protein